MTIVVTTPTGKVGSRVVRLLVQAGERPRVLLRDPARLDPEIAAHVDAVPSDQHDGDAVLEATRGAGAVYWVSPPVFDRDPVEAHAQAGEHVARAVREHGIGRVVFQSSVGAEHRHGIGEIDGLARSEELLDATGAAVTHLRCGYFFTNLLFDPEGLEQGVVTTLADLDAPMPWVDPRDVGDVAAARLLSRTWSGRHTLGVHGPRDLTWHEVAETLAAVTGRPFSAVQLREQDVRDGIRAAGMPDPVIDAMVGMPLGLRGRQAEDERSARTTTPTTLASWAQEHLR